MITLEILATFLGWCFIVNFAFLLLFTAIIMIWREPIARLHSRLFKLDKETLPKMYFEYLGNYKMATYIFNLVPYIALKIMT